MPCARAICPTRRSRSAERCSGARRARPAPVYRSAHRTWSRAGLGDAGNVPSRANEYGEKLGESLGELERVYPSLLDSIEEHLAERLNAARASVRDDLRVRAERLAGQIIDPQLKAFANALQNRDTSREAWLEQIGMVIARTAPSSWTDDDRISGLQVLAQLSLSFRRVESLHFSQTRSPANHSTPSELL